MEAKAATLNASKEADQANKGALREIRARVIEIRKAAPQPGEPPKSEAVSDDPFSSLTEAGRIIEPPFDMLTLAMLGEHSSELGQCVEAMEMNIDATGHRFVPRVKLDELEANPKPETDPLLQAVRAEKIRLENFFTYATIESFVAWRRKLRCDLEYTGNAYFEVLRSSDREIQGFTHLPSYQMRLGTLDDEPLLATRKILELQLDGSVVTKERKEWRRFRRFVQSRSIQRRGFTSLGGHKMRWFKEFGDPRQLNKNTGDFGADVPPEQQANEVIHLRLHSPRTPYGIPRYIGNLLSIFGDRAAEEINYVTFRNNNIPSMILMVSNGQLTEGTISRIQTFVESQIQGSDNYSKFLIVEGEPFGEEGEDGGQVKIEAKPLTNDQHKDALFQNYSSNNHDKIRRAFRLPPIFVGRAEDYTRATAESSRRLADEQIFQPDRNEFDALINRVLFPEMNVVCHRFQSSTPNTTDSQLLVKIITDAEKTGGITPRIARQILEDILGIDLPAFPADFPADIPFSLTMAEAVKNLAPEPATPGQSVTALKALGILGNDGGLEIDENEDIMAIAKKLLAVNRAVETMWRTQQQG